MCNGRYEAQTGTGTPRGPSCSQGELKRQPLLTEGELTRMVRLMNKEHIKANNNALRKSK